MIIFSKKGYDMNKQYIQEMLDNFLKLPRRAQELFFEDLNEDANLIMKGKKNHDMFIVYSLADAFNTEGCKSPIEQILYMALTVRLFGNYFDIESQKEIIADSGKKYFADFAIFNVKDDNVYDLLLLVECDGHDFHEKTKAQVKRDNEREYDLRMSGYDILHFSGSQIYADPFKCADEILAYCEKKVGAE